MEEVQYRTPNGLHDAYLLGLSVNYRKQVLSLELNWLIGTPDGGTEEEREGYQEGTLNISGLQYFVVESPRCELDEPSYIDGFATRVSDIEQSALPDIPSNCFRHSLFVGESNSFIHFAGASAEVLPASLIVREMRP